MHSQAGVVSLPPLFSLLASRLQKSPMSGNTEVVVGIEVLISSHLMPSSQEFCNAMMQPGQIQNRLIFLSDSMLRKS